MKKNWIVVATALALVLAAFFAYQYRPSKRFARHVSKARLFAAQKNFVLADKEYEAAYALKGGYKPTVAMEVVNMQVEWAMSEKKSDKALTIAREFVEANPNNVEGQRLLARMQFVTGDVDGFFKTTENLLTAHPQDFPGRFLLAQFRMRQNRLDLAEEELAFLYHSYPDSIVTLLPLAEVVMKRGDFQRSRNLLLKILKLRPKLALARMYLMDTYLMEQKTDSAQMVLDQWTNDDKSLEAGITIRKAHLLSLQNKLEAAGKLLEPYTKALNPNLNALSEMAMLKAKQGKYDSAYKMYQIIAEAKPDEARTPFLFGALILMANHQPAQALEVLRRLQVGDKAQSLAFYVTACFKAMDMANRTDTLIAMVPEGVRPLLKDFRDQIPADKEFLSRWARVNYFQINEQNYWALVEADSLYKAYPKNPAAINVYAQRLAAIRQFDAAVAIMEKLPKPTLRQKATMLEWLLTGKNLDKGLKLALALHQENPKIPGINFNIGNIYMQQNQPAKAAPYFEAELQISPGNLVCLNNLAWEYGIRENDLAKATPYLKQLREKNISADPSFFDTIGWVLGKQGQMDDAQLYLHKALNLSPGNPSMLYHMAWVDLKIGKAEEGKKLLDEALSSTADFQEKSEAKILFAGLK